VEPTSLVAGRDYPNTYRSFVEMFPDNASCTEYLIKLRWPQGFICSACKTSVIPWQSNHGRLICPVCRHFTYVGAGTIFDKTRTPLTTWFEAAWHVSTAKNGFVSKNTGAYARDELSRCMDYAPTFSRCHGRCRA